MSELPAAVEELAERLGRSGWVTGLLAAGSLATGDHVPGVSDLDLVAVVDGPVGAARVSELAELHRGLDEGRGAGIDRGCVYVDSDQRLDRQARHPAMSDDEVRDAARAELLGCWGWAARRPCMWVDPVIADLGLTSMARARHTLAAGDLLTKSRAIDEAGAPGWLRDQLRARRRGEDVRSPRLRTAFIAWRDARRTVVQARS